MENYIKCRPAMADAMRSWICSMDSAKPFVDVLVRPTPPKGWEARADWLGLFLQQNPDVHRRIQAAEHDADPRVKQVRTALGALAWPEHTNLVELGLAGDADFHWWLTSPAARRRIQAIMLICGYDKYPNPRDKQGRWMVNGRRTKAYRQIRNL